ncbi:MAG: hypothetical protein EBT86_07520 [Actinobacteria bacterium]|nr:hypothetical protein [Actinomycetota bacterium]
MGVALSSLPEGDTDFIIASAGPLRINQMATEFSNVSERGLKARGIKNKVIKVPPTWIKDNIHSIGYFAYFSKPKEPVSSLVDLAEAKDVEVGVYRY